MEQERRLDMPGALAHYSLEGQIAIVSIDHPPMNALDVATKEALAKVFLELEELGDQIRVVILRGEGEKAFAAGADIKTFLELTPKKAKKRLMRSHQIYKLIEEFEWPTIAAIHGYCLGAGLELALCCDIRYVAESAKLGFPEVRISVFPGNGGTQRALYNVPLGKLKEWVYTGAIIDAQEAFRYGLVEKVVSDEMLMEEVMGLANRILKNGPLGVSNAKKVLNRTRDLALEDGLELESDFWANLTATEDMKEGAKAFIEKREPKYKCK